VTVTVVLHVTVPPAPVAVPVYTVVDVGDTECDPLATGVTDPIPRFIENDVALFVVHDRVEADPVCMEEGDAESTQVGAGGGGVV
jgi:hypothetical protein